MFDVGCCMLHLLELHVGCCILHVGCCMLHVVCCSSVVLHNFDWFFKFFLTWTGSVRAEVIHRGDLKLSECEIELTLRFMQSSWGSCGSLESWNRLLFGCLDLLLQIGYRFWVQKLCIWFGTTTLIWNFMKILWNVHVLLGKLFFSLNLGLSLKGENG